MKRMKLKAALGGMSIIGLLIVLASFSKGMGGDSYRIYLNHQLLVDQAVLSSKPIKTIMLNSGVASYQLEVYYSHCGQPGRERSIRLTDANNRLLKKWQFPESGVNEPMICNLQDINGMKAGNADGRMNLVYSSRELPQGRTLATVVTSASTKAMP